MAAARGLVLASLLLAGCAATIRVDARIEHPPALDLSAFRALTVIHDADHATIAVVDGLVTELRARGIAAEARSSAAAPDTLAGTLLVVQVIANVVLRTEWSMRPENVCGPYGCYVRNVSQPIDMPYLVGRYTARLEDASTRRVLEATSGQVETIGTADAAGRRRLADLVVEKIVYAIDPHVEEVRLALESLDDPVIDEALEAVREGAFAEARGLIEARLARSAETDAARRARMHYDLALLIAFDPASADDAEARARAVEHAIESVRLDPTSRHVAALERVRTMSAEARLAEDRRERGGATPMPVVPDAYRATIPEP